MKLTLTPIDFDEACAFIRAHHRHHQPPRGWKFGVAVNCADGEVAGVIMVGRPVSRRQDDGWTLEAIRCCTTGTKNAASMLYAAAWRAARALGYRKLITYTLASETGVSLKAAGYRVIHQTRAQSWDRPGRRRIDKHPTESKLLWEASA